MALNVYECHVCGYTFTDSLGLRTHCPECGGRAVAEADESLADFEDFEDFWEDGEDGWQYPDFDPDLGDGNEEDPT